LPGLVRERRAERRGKATDAGERGDAEEEADGEQAEARQPAAQFAQGEGPGEGHGFVIPAHDGISAGEAYSVCTR
jgi:hypothetical protein